MFRKIILNVFLLLPVIMAGAQDINFSQFYELPLLRNPALGGIFRGDMRVAGAYRTQWISAAGVPYRTQALGVELKSGVSESTYDYKVIGLQVTNDQAGDSKMGKTQVMPAFTFHKSLSDEKDSYLTLGAIGGIVQQRFDPTGLKFDDQFVNGEYSETNPTQQTFTRTNVTYWDYSMGLLYSGEFGSGIKYYLGAAAFHIFKPKVAFNTNNEVRLNRKFIFNGGLSAPTSPEDRVILYVDVFMQGGNRQAQGGFMYRHDMVEAEDDETVSISAGSFLRWGDAIIPVIKLDMYKMGIGMTYDINISKLSAASRMRGGFEVTVSYRDFLNIRNSSSQKLRCPVSL